MNMTASVSFESYYYFELLENIRKKSREAYNDDSRSYLEKLLLFLERFENAESSIENLAQAQSTSDLAIFFSDILDQLHGTQPEDSLEKMNDRVRDFLEIFQVFLQNDEWRSAIRDEVYSRLDEDVAAPASPEMSFAEYCRQLIAAQVAESAAALPAAQREEYQALAGKLLENPDLANQVELSFDHADIDGFFQITYAVSQLPGSPEAAEDQDAFTSQIDEWVQRFQKIYETDAQAVRDLMPGIIAEPAQPKTPVSQKDTEEEVPFEALFDEAEAEVMEEPDDAAAFEKAAMELDALVESISNRDASLSKTPEEDETTLERRLKLRGYVIGEIELLTEEATEALDALAETPLSPDHSLALKEALKGLKDLGQIHGYPVIELASDGLLRMYALLQHEKQVFPAVEKAPIMDILFAYPDYVNAVIEERGEDAGREIQEKLSLLQSRLFEREPALSVYSAETLEGALQDVVSRYVRVMQEKLADPAAVDDAALAPAFENLRYWSDLLLPDSAKASLDTLKTLYEPGCLEELDAQQQQLLSDILKSWESAYATDSEETWQSYAGQLDAIYTDATGAVPPADALEAFREVTDRQFNALFGLLEKPDVNIGDFVNDDFQVFLDQFRNNCGLTGQVQLSNLADTLRDRLNAVDAESWDADAISAVDVQNFLAVLKNMVLTDEAPDETAMLEYFDEMVADITATETELETAESVEETEAAWEPEDTADSAEDVLEIADSAEEVEAELESVDTVEAAADVLDTAETADDKDITEDELMAVFKVEAYGYLTDIEEQLGAIEDNIDNWENWRNFGVTAHTLKGAAQMVGRSDIAEMAEPLDRSVDLAENKTIPADIHLLGIFRNITMVIQDRVNDKSVDSRAVLAELEDFISQSTGLPLGEDGDSEDYIYLREQDPELLSIFQNEVTSNFDIVEKNLTNLEKFNYDKEAVQQVERATHEIRAAAKMLGITEIAALADHMENIFEQMGQRKITELQTVIPVARRGIMTIRELTNNHKVRRETYTEVLAELEIVTGAAPETPQIDAVGIEAEPFTEAPLFATSEPTESEVDDAESAEADDIASVKPQVMELFLQEAREQLDDINYLLMKLEKDTNNEELQHHLMRCMHTLKGSAGMVYARRVEALSHRCEDILERHLQEKRPLPQPLFDLLFEVMDEVQYGMESLEKTGKEKTRKYTPLLSGLDAYYEEMTGEAEADVTPETDEAPAASETAPADEPSSVRLVSAEEADEKKPQKDAYLRLNISKMNQLLNLAAESVISNNQFKNQLDGLKGFIQSLNTNLKSFRDTEEYLSGIIREERKIQELLEEASPAQPAAESLKKQLGSLLKVMTNVRSLQDELSSATHSLKENTKTYDENLQKISKLSNELLDEIMQARLVPMNLLFQRFHRPIRDLARQMEKQIRLSMHGEETEMDRTLVDELYEPLLHIIRNAIDHGLESAEERKAAGKDPEGLLEIKASRDRNQVIIEVRDDGRGIDLESIVKQAIEKELLTEKDAKTMSEQELFEYIFYPGFSTAKETTLVSGRGVGLDAVKSHIEKAKGDVRMYTEPGKGTTFSIRVPISLSVIQSMLVDVSGHVYSVPLMQVEETLHVSGKDLLKEDDKTFIRYRERQIPVMQLSRLLKIRNAEEKSLSATSYPVIMVQDDGNRVALLVDKIIRREEILIKSLGPGLRRLKYISGGSIMADGQVVLVLDIPQIIVDVRKDLGAGAVVPMPAAGSETHSMPAAGSADRLTKRKKRIEGRKPVALIVDDSLSIRKYLSSLLIQKGYITDTARNGYEALDLLNKQNFDIMVTDLEMPKLSGYELIETIRYDKRFNNFPIVVLTGRAGENFRQLTQELGADAYIIKPFKDSELFEQMDKFIEHKP